MPRQRWCLAAVLGLCILAIPTIFRGAVTEVPYFPGPPLLVGEYHEFLPISDNFPTGLYSMEWRCAGNPPGDWTEPWFLELDPFGLTHHRVATYDDRFGAEEQPDEEEPATWSYKTEQHTVLGPDKDEVASGLNVDSVNGLVEVRFNVLRGTTPIGWDIDVYAQEHLETINPQTLAATQSGWLDEVEDKYYWDEPGQVPQIVDNKFIDTTSGGFQAAAVGQEVLWVEHKNRLVIKDCLGVDQYFEFEEHLFKVIKTGANTWKLIEVEPAN